MKYFLSIIASFIYIVSFAQVDTLINANFNNCILPNDWQVQVEGEQHLCLYNIGTYRHDSITAFNSTIDSCMFYFNDDKLGNNSLHNWSAQVITPKFDAAYYSNIFLDVDVFFRNYNGQDFFRILVFNGFEYIEIDRFQGQNYTGTTFDTYVSKNYDLSPYINCDMSVIFEYDDGGTWGWYCGFDNVVLTGVGSSQTDLQSYNFNACNNEGWSNQSLSSSVAWNFNTAYQINGSCNANINSVGTNTLDKTQLTSPNFSTLGVERLFLKYHISAYLPYYAYLKTLLVSGNDTSIVKNHQRVGNINETILLNITDYKDPNTKIIFEYGNNDIDIGSWAAIDDIEIYGIGTALHETCDNALPLYSNASCEMGCTMGAFFEKNPPSCYAENKSGVWYQFIASQNEMTIKVQSDFNDVLTVFSGTCTGLNEIACSNEDEFGFGGETLSLTGLNIGNNYFVRVSGADCNYGKPEGTFCIELKGDINTLPPPINDNCVGAITLATTSGNTGNNCINGENLSATFSNISPSCNQNTKADIWYHFQANSSDSLYISTQASFAEAVTIYEGNCGNLVEITCVDYGHHLVVSNLTIGNDYYIQIAGAFATLLGEVCISMDSNCAGIACDDNDPDTFNDVFDENCQCSGLIYCLNVGDICDDGDNNTINEFINSDCECLGECTVVGMACDDGNPITINDVYDVNCECSGVCPSAGTACDDGNPNTVNDMFDTECNCFGDDCPQDLYVNNIFEAGANDLYQCSNELSSDAIVENGANLIYKAGNRIRLTQGFHGKKGAYFHGYLENCGVDSTINVKNAIIVPIAIKIFLEGCYDTGSGAMWTRLLDDELLPLKHQYHVTPWNYTKDTKVTGVNNFPVNTVDWVLVEIRQGTPVISGATPGTALIERQVALLQSDGNIVNTSGNPLNFRNLIEGNAYHLLVRHRNHLDVISASPIVVSQTAINEYDFTIGVNQAFGNNQQKALSDGRAVLYSGDFNADAFIQNTDYDVWKIQPALLYTYSMSDGNLDGVVQTSDFDTWIINKAKVAISEVRLQ